MKRFALLMVAIMMVSVAGAAMAEPPHGCPPPHSCIKTTDTQDVRITIPRIVRLDVIPEDIHLNIDCHDLLDGFGSVTAHGHYFVITNLSSQKITAKIDSAMPANTALKATLGAVAGAASQGQKTLTTTPQDMVKNISNVAGMSSIDYVLSANLLAAPVTTTKVVTYVIMSQI